MQKMFGFARQRMGPKWMILLQAGASRHKRARHKGNGRLKDKKRTTRKEYRRLWKEFEAGGFMAHRGLWKVATDRGALLEEEGDLVRE